MKYDFQFILLGITVLLNYANFGFMPADRKAILENDSIF
jgi:hypothetical protein